MRGTTNSNARGNSRDREARKRYLLKAYASDWSDGCVSPSCRCYRCGVLLNNVTLTVDRIVPGCKGGKYVRTNIRPACSSCNSETGGGVRSWAAQ